MKTLLTLATAFACAFHLAGAKVRLHVPPAAPRAAVMVQAN
jgi:hypothetical protein